jgi:hypothetical protein
MSEKMRRYRIAVAETADALAERVGYCSGHINAIMKYRPHVAIDHYHLLWHLDLFIELLTENFEEPLDPHTQY